MPRNTTATLLSDQLHQKPTLCYGDSPHPTNANPEKATDLHGERGSVLHSNALPHHPAPVAEEVHRQGQSRMRRPRQEGEKPSFGLKPSTCGRKGVKRITKG